MDYEKLVFRSGIEIHQQVDGKKLFCSCPTINSQKEPDIRVERKLRTTASELGKIDAAAQYEAGKNLKFIYEANSEDCCLVEYDEEPPHAVNPNALRTALTVALLLNARIVDEIRFMRKIVIDGSNTSGFQRTALIATDGFIETSKGKVLIPTICLEEEAAQKVEAGKDFIRYRLDRLGIPLIEIGTDASIKDPEHAKEVAAYLGMVLRSVGVKRGLGTIRQDLNVSIKGHPRVEIKGFQELKSIPRTIENEVKRQVSEAGKATEPHVRKAEPDFTTSYLRPMPGADRMYPETDVLPIKPDASSITIPKLLTERAEEMKGLGISSELSLQLVKSNKLVFFESLSSEFKHLEPEIIAQTIIVTPKEVKKRFKSEEPSEDHIRLALKALDKGEISKDALVEVLAALASGKEADLKKYAKLSEKELDNQIKEIIKENKGLPLNALIGKAMERLRGRADGQLIVSIIKKLYK